MKDNDVYILCTLCVRCVFFWRCGTLRCVILCAYACMSACMCTACVCVRICALHMGVCVCVCVYIAFFVVMSCRLAKDKQAIPFDTVSMLIEREREETRQPTKA